MTVEKSAEISRLMAGFRRGDKESTNQLVELLYPELRRMAAGKIRGEHTWQPTVLVHELYLELVKVKALESNGADSDERTSFLRFCAFLMRRILSHHDRPLYRKAKKIPLSDEPFVDAPGEETLQYMDGLLVRLEAIDPRLRRVVELKVFGGMTGDEIAVELRCSRRTVATCWNFAKRSLQKEMAVFQPS